MIKLQSYMTTQSFMFARRRETLHEFVYLFIVFDSQCGKINDQAVGVSLNFWTYVRQN